MNKLKYIFSIVVLLLLMNATKGQTTLTLEQCRAQAIEFNKELKMAAFDKSKAEVNKKVARTAYLPSVEVDATIMHSPRKIDGETPGGFLPTADSEEAAARGEYTGQSNVYSPGMSLSLNNLTYITGGLSINQPIYVGGKIRNSNKMAEIGVEISDMAYTLKYCEVIELTDQAFWQVAMVEANIELVESYIKMLTELEEQMSEMFELGLTPASEKLKVSVKKNEADLQLLKARNGLKLAKMYLNQVIGNDLNAEINIEYEDYNVKLIDLSNGLNMAMSNRDELKIMQKKVELSEYDKKIALAEYLPSAGVSAQYTKMYVADLVTDLEFQPMIAGQVTIPLFKWGQGKHKQKAASIEILKAKEDLENTNDLIAVQVLQVKLQVEEAYEAVLIAQKNIDEAEESLAETKASFEVGLNTISDLLNAQADWQKAKADLITAKANFKVLETAWYKATGKLNAIDQIN